MSNKFYEERTVVFRATNTENALNIAEKEAIEYAKNIGDIKFMGYSETFKLTDNELDSGTEVYSCMRYSDLDASSYVKRFMKTGNEVNLD